MCVQPVNLNFGNKPAVRLSGSLHEAVFTFESLAVWHKEYSVYVLWCGNHRPLKLNATFLWFHWYLVAKLSQLKEYGIYVIASKFVRSVLDFSTTLLLDLLSTWVECSIVIFSCLFTSITMKIMVIVAYCLSETIFSPRCHIFFEWNMSFVHLAGCDKRYFPGTATVVDCMCLLHSKHLICGPVLSFLLCLLLEVICYNLQNTMLRYTLFYLVLDIPAFCNIH